MQENRSPFPHLWGLDPAVTFLNHGSFGACPLAVLDVQTELRRELEAQPLRFFTRGFDERMDAALGELGEFVGAQGQDLAWVSNATAGVNTVLRSLEFAHGDELLATDHTYAACRNAMDDVARRSGAQVKVAAIPFPLTSADQVVDAILGAVNSRTRLALVDHVTSPTGLVLPIDRLVAALQERGIDVLVDGAHGPGMLPLDLDRLGAAYYTGNCHKWLCAPKGSAFLHVRRDRQARVRPLSVSHGFASSRTDRSRFRLEFDWTGTPDPTPMLCVPAAIRFVGNLLPGGWPAWMAANRALALHARDQLCAAVGVPVPCPEAMVGSLAAVPLPDLAGLDGGVCETDALQERLYQAGFEVPVFHWPALSLRILRVAAQGYNDASQFDRLAAWLRQAGAAIEPPKPCRDWPIESASIP